MLPVRFETRTLEQLTVEDRSSFEHVALYARLEQVLRRDGFRFAFFSDEGNPREPPHVHVSGGGKAMILYI